MDYKEKFESLLRDIDIAIAGQKEGEMKTVLQNLKERNTERDDEKIRKELIKVFSNREKYLIDQSFGDITVSEALTWLEKQGEKKPAENKGMNLVEEEMTPFQKKVFCIIDTTIEEEQGLKQVCDELLRLAHDEIMQKPAWSEEDEQMINDIIEAIDTPYSDQELEMVTWLKSLKPQPHWKPSEEQMGDLKKVYETYYACDGERCALESLYNDLKKL